MQEEPGIMGDRTWGEESWERNHTWKRDHGKRNHGRGIMGEGTWEEESWERNHGRGIMGEGIMEEESWERNHGNLAHLGGLWGGIWKHLKASGGAWGSKVLLEVKSAKTMAFYSQRGRDRAFRVDGSDPTLTISAACAQK